MVKHVRSVRSCQRHGVNLETFPTSSNLYTHELCLKSQKFTHGMVYETKLHYSYTSVTCSDTSEDQKGASQNVTVLARSTLIGDLHSINSSVNYLNS